MTNTDTSIQTWKYHAGSGVAAVDISDDGETIIAGTLGKMVLSLNSQGQPHWQVKVGNQAWRVGLSNDGQIMVVGTGSTRPWDMGGRGLFCLGTDGTLRWQVDLKASVWGLALSADGQTVAAGTSGKQLLCFDSQGQRLWQQDVPGLGWYAWVFGAALSADGQIVAAAAADKRVRLLERSGLHVAEFRSRGELYIVAISATGQVVATGDTKGYVYLLNRQGQLLWEERLADKVWAVALSTDGQRLLVGAGEKEKHLYTYNQSGRLLWRRFVEGSVNNLALSANGRRVVVGTRSGGIHIFGEDGEVLHKAQAGKLVRQVAISATGERIVVGSEDGYVYGFQLPPLAPLPSVSAEQGQSQPQPSGTIYNIHIEQAAGLAIGDKAQVLQDGGEPGNQFNTSTENLRPQEPIEAQYVNYLRQQYGHVPLGGIAPRVQDRVLNIPLDELFVPLQAEPNAPLQAQFVISSKRGFEAVRKVDPRFVGLDEITAQLHVVILGEPGAGKSTFLRWLVARTLDASDASDEGSTSKIFPIFIRLVNLAAVLERQPDLSIAQYLQHRHLPEYQKLFELLLTSGRGWLLLDGLDEVADPQLRHRIRDNIETFTVQYPDFHVVVTSRIVGYRGVQFQSSFRHFTLQPFGWDEITFFVQNWYRVVCRLTGSSGYAEAERRANRLLDELKDKPQVLQLAGTPLLLAIIALMDWKDKAIPKRRVELYKEATETLLEYWPAEHRRPIESELSINERLQVLAGLAFEMFETGQSEAIRQDWLETHLIGLVQDVCKCSRAEARTITLRWLPWLSEHSGLLLDAGVDEFSHPVYTFLHLSFVEYLGGRALAERWYKGGLDLARYANDPRWREVILLMAGHIGMAYSITDATRVVEEIYVLKPPHYDILHQSLVLAAACLADDVQTLPNLRAETLDKVVLLWQRSGEGLLRSKLFRILAAMGGTDSAAEIIERIGPLANDNRVWVRSSVLELLGKLGRPTDPTLKAQLLTALKDPDKTVQHAAVRALETLGLAYDSEVRAALLQALQQSEVSVRTRAALALSPVVDHDREVMVALLHTLAQDGDIQPRVMAARALGVIRQPQDEVFTGMLAALWDQNVGVRKEAVTTLVRWGKDGRKWLVAELSRALQDPDPKNRRLAIRIVANIGIVLHPEATELLLKVAEGDEDLSVRAAAIRWLGTLPTTNTRILHLLMGALSSKSNAERRYAAQALKNLAVRDLQISLALVQALKISNVEVQKFVAEALGKCGLLEAEIVNPLEDILSSENEFVRLFAAEALVEIGAKSVKAQETLTASLRSNNAEVRRRAAQELRRMIHRLDSSVITILIKLVKDESRDVREQALLALAESGREAGTEIKVACRAALQDDYHKVRERAAEALGKFGQVDEATISALLTTLNDSHDQVRLAASNALITLGDGPEREMIINRVRVFFDEKPSCNDALNTLWGLVVGEA